jgi:hypothetical protein
MKRPTASPVADFMPVMRRSRRTPAQKNVGKAEQVGGLEARQRGEGDRRLSAQGARIAVLPATA